MIPVQQFGSSVLAELIRRQPPSPGRTALAWQLAVGVTLARATKVVLEDGVLRVSASDPRWLQEVSRARAVVLERLRQVLGSDVGSLVIDAGPPPRGR